MLRKLIARKAMTPETDGHEDGTTRLDRMKAAYDEWRMTQDIGAVMSALGRLSDRQLAMIGLRRDGLYGAVTEMMDRVEEQGRIADEVLALLDKAPARGEAPAPQAAEGVRRPEAATSGERAAA